jgi:hypothetical protein
MIEIFQTNDIDIGDVIRRSPWCKVPSAGRTLAECLMMSSYSWIGKCDGEVACAWGLIPPSLLSERAYLWLVTTDLVEQHQFLFVRHSRRCMAIMLEKYQIIVGHSSVSEAHSLRWLRWLGAEFFECEGGQLAFQIRKK